MKQYRIDYILDLPTDYIKSRFRTPSSSDVDRYTYLKLLRDTNKLDVKSSKIFDLVSFRHLVSMSDKSLKELVRNYDQNLDVEMSRSQAIFYLLSNIDKLYLYSIDYTSVPIDRIGINNVHLYDDDIISGELNITSIDEAKEVLNDINEYIEEESHLLLEAMIGEFVKNKSLRRFILYNIDPLDLIPVCDFGRICTLTWITERYGIHSRVDNGKIKWYKDDKEIDIRGMFSVNTEDDLLTMLKSNDPNLKNAIKEYIVILSIDRE